jgi:hypothetical protein
MATTDPTTIDDPTIAGEHSTYQEPDPLTDAGRVAGERAGELKDRATDVGFQQADKVTDQAAEGITQVADSIRRVSLDMQTDQPTISNLADTAAEQADRFAAYLRETDARQMLNSVEDMARRQPLRRPDRAAGATPGTGSRTTRPTGGDRWPTRLMDAASATC